MALSRAAALLGLAATGLAQSGCHDRAAPGGTGTPHSIAPEPPRASGPAGASANAPTGVHTPLAPSGQPTSASPPGAPASIPAGGAPLLARPWLSLTKADLEAAAQKAGCRLEGSSESEGDSGRLLRIVKISRGTFRGSVAWYKTDDVEGARTSVAKGAPHRVEGGVLIAVKPLDPAGRPEAEALLRTLAGP